jgi:hypothetical protein
MAAKPMLAARKALKRLSYLRGRQRGGNIGFGFPEAKYQKFGGGKGVIVIANASVAPKRNIAGAGILYVKDGALMYLGSNGRRTCIAPA